VNILLSCIGKSDPVIEFDGKLIPGPIITLLEERAFDHVHLLWAIDEDMNRRANKTRLSILNMPDTSPDVHLHGFDAMDPTDLSILYTEMGRKCRDIKRDYPQDSTNYFIQCSSGTPQMQSVWMALACGGAISAKLLSVRPRYIAGIRRPYAREIDFNPIDEIALHHAETNLSHISTAEDEINRLKMEIELLKTGGSVPDIDNECLDEGFNLTEYLSNEKRKYYAMALSKRPGNAAKAARMLGLDPHTFTKAAASMGLRSRSKD